MRVTEFPTTLPMEYSEEQGTVYGALAYHLSADSMFMLSIRNMPVGNSLNARIFYANEYELDSIAVTAYILSKELHMAERWEGYKYGLGFVQISKEDRRKLEGLVNSNSNLEHISGRQDGVAWISSLTKTSLPFLPNSDLPKESTTQCKSYQNGKCLRTGAFCDLCQLISSGNDYDRPFI